MVTERSLVCTKLPRTSGDLAMWSKGARGGAAGGIPATSPAGLAGEAAREGPGVERKWPRGLLTSEGRPATGDGGRRRQRPREEPLRRVGSSGRSTSELGSY
jgi:hypothetical protein